VLYAGDYAIAAMSILLFLLSVVVLFFIARHLFDQRLAIMACGLLLLCNMFWQYALSGLPQMLMLFLFNCTIYALIRAVDAQSGGGRVGIWLALVGFGFALLALSNALTIWIFVAALLVFAFFFHPRGWAALIALVVFGIVYVPWLIRNYVVCGNPAGIASYSVFDGMGHPEAAWMRHMNLSLEGLVRPLAFRDKVITNFFLQAGNLFGYFGYSLVAIMFFAALVYGFRRRETRMVRWMLAVMWVGAVAGMSIFGLNEEQGFAANQLHLLFVPVMTCYGLAFLLVLWRRLEIQLRVARIGFITLLFVLCALPFIFRLPGLKPTEGAIRWPPYVPPYIAVLNDWMKPNEITASDMPWAVAWYADRRALLLPETIKEMIDISDYRVLGGPVYGLYITPISGSENKLGDITRGEYKAWAAVIFRSLNLETFPLKWIVSLGLDNECIFFSDHNRQETTGASP
jgi:4-amino-4-deoxy-L-arabinose transferase-like glycosyltransferase